MSPMSRQKKKAMLMWPSAGHSPAEYDIGYPVSPVV